MANTGLLLAGGRNSRFGKPKFLLDFGGQPLGRLVLERLALVTEHQLVAANDSSPFAGWGVPVVADVFPGAGPLAGLHAGLRRAADETVLACASDMPFFSPALGRWLLSLAEGFDVVMPRHEGLTEPLCAVYARTCLGAMEEQLLTGGGRVTAILPGLRVRYVEAEEYAPFGDPALLFFNVNRPADLERAEYLRRAMACPAAPAPASRPAKR